MNDEILEKIQKRGNIPRHIAIIMDGNGRWAKNRGLPRVDGHREGIKSVREIVETSVRIGIETLTLYTFSSENWKRPKQEVSALMTLLLKTIRKEVNDLHRNNVRVKIIGRLKDLPRLPRTGMEEAIKQTSENTGMTLNLALSYSSRIEILTAIRTIAQKCLDGDMEIGQIDENTFSDHLYTEGLRDPDLMIRTSGEFRISNFLLWQAAYTEIYFTDTLWPDFRQSEFLKAIENFQSRERRFGKVSEQL